MTGPIILLPGSLCDEGMWQPQIEPLSTVGEPRVVSISGYDSVDAMASHVLDAVKEPVFALAGFSLGGFVALQIMRVAPERVSHLALLSTSATPDPAENRQARLDRISAPANRLPELVDAFADMLGGPDSAPDMLAQCRATMQKHGGADYAAQQKALMNRPDARDVLPNIACPTLVMAGSEDRAVPRALSRDMASAIPDATYLELSGSGHMISMERHEQVSDALCRLLSNR